jgi:hypothetical protein
MTTKLIALTTFALLFSGCAEKLVFAKVPCMQLEYIILPEPVSVRVHREDEALLNAYVKELRGKIELQHNDVVKKHNETCDKWEIMK